MRSKLKVLLAVLVVLAAFPVRAAHTRATLVLAADSAKPGDTILVGVRLLMDPHWHTYWKNPGAAGLETTLKWTLPAGLTAGDIQWPAPEKFPPDDLTTYGYENEVVLLVSIKLAPDLHPGPHDLKVHAAWLECEQQCVKGSADLSATLTVGAETRPSADADLIAAWQKQLPQSGNDLAARAWWDGGARGDRRQLLLEWSASAAAEADFFPLDSSNIEVQGATARLSGEAGKVRLRKEVKKFEGDWPKQISGLLIGKTADGRAAFSVTLPIASAGAQSSGSADAPESLRSGTADATAKSSQPLWKLLLAGFLGGIILNVMPCVFPVIALKILGFVQQSRQAPEKIFRHGLVYTAGVFASFVVFAAVVIAVRRVTGAATWGMQLQSAWFTLLLTVVTMLVALNLFGVFEITLSGGLMNTAGQLAARDGMAGTFFNGVLATVLATPCTGPFLAYGAGIAFTQSSDTVVAATCLAVALGLALPYVALSWQPGWLKFLPRPGPWMEKFKKAMGFPMLATMVWLLSFNMPRFGSGGRLRLGLLLVLIAMAAWVWGEFVQRGRTRRALAVVLSLALAAGGAALAFVHDAPSWQKWSPQAVEQARAEGRPVLVDFTAEWCWQCIVNKRVAIDVAEVQSRLKEINAVMLVGDNTDEDAAIVAELKKFDRAGVPLVLVYPRKSEEPPEVLPSVLTPGIVLDALHRAAN